MQMSLLGLQHSHCNAGRMFVTENTCHFYLLRKEDFLGGNFVGWLVRGLILKPSAVSSAQKALLSCAHQLQHLLLSSGLSGQVKQHTTGSLPCIYI